MRASAQQACGLNGKGAGAEGRGAGAGNWTRCGRGGEAAAGFTGGRGSPGPRWSTVVHGGQCTAGTARGREHHCSVQYSDAGIHMPGHDSCWWTCHYTTAAAYHHTLVMQ